MEMVRFQQQTERWTRSNDGEAKPVVVEQDLGTVEILVNRWQTI